MEQITEPMENARITVWVPTH